MAKRKTIKLNPHNVAAYSTKSGMTMKIFGSTKSNNDYLIEYDFDDLFWFEHFHVQLSDILQKKKQDVDRINSLFNKQ